MYMHSHDAQIGRVIHETYVADGQVDIPTYTLSIIKTMKKNKNTIGPWYGCLVMWYYVYLDPDSSNRIYRANSRFTPSQWETGLLCNDVSHWPSASLESALDLHISDMQMKVLVSQSKGIGAKNRTIIRPAASLSHSIHCPCITTSICYEPEAATKTYFTLQLKSYWSCR